MSDQTLSTAPPWYASLPARMLIGAAVTAAIVLAAFGPGGLAFLSHLAVTANWRPHAPNWALLAQASTPIKIHLATILAAFVLGTIQMVGPKGRTAHRVLGWTIAVLFVTTAIAALFIHGPRQTGFNPLYLFSIWTLIAMPLGVWAARAHKVGFHSRMMNGFYFGSLIVAGAFAFIPGRLMWRLFFG